MGFDCISIFCYRSRNGKFWEVFQPIWCFRRVSATSSTGRTQYAIVDRMDRFSLYNQLHYSTLLACKVLTCIRIGSGAKPAPRKMHSQMQTRLAYVTVMYFIYQPCLFSPKTTRPRNMMDVTECGDWILRNTGPTAALGGQPPLFFFQRTDRNCPCLSHARRQRGYPP